MEPSAQYEYVIQTSAGRERTLEAPPKPPFPVLFSRETVEQVAMAVVLAFMFRAFLAEAFIIPTGSMAPTLMGRHVDLECPQCGYQFQAGASGEEPQDASLTPRGVVGAVCQNCRYFFQLDPRGDSAHRSYPGDRILVSKLAYGLHEPERWDVIVFKFPDDPKENYIKRLIGLPNEWITIYGGDIYTGKTDGPSNIARKPPQKIKAMAQLVYDTKYTPKSLLDAGFPRRWSSPDGREGWQAADDGRSYSLGKPTKKKSWLYYRHYLPRAIDWEAVAAGESVPGGHRPQLITDFYSYNAHIDEMLRDINSGAFRPGLIPLVYGEQKGLFWVGDLMVDCDIEVLSNAGTLTLELIEAGRHHTCEIDVESGKATLVMDGGSVPFGVGDVQKPTLTGHTPIRGAGRYRVRFANVDSQLVLWVNERVVELDQPGVYEVDPFEDVPAWSPEDPGDFAPARIAVQNTAATLHRIRLWRDIYYIATTVNAPLQEYEGGISSQALGESFIDPRAWATYDIFRRRQWIRFELAEDQFFPMGDNSPQSSDARGWDGGHYVERRLLIGKALAVFWPHPLRKPIPFFPNFKRMKWIR